MKKSRTFTPADTNFLLTHLKHPVTGNEDVIVAGAGVFGSWCALKFLRHGYKVKLFDPLGSG